MIRGLEEITKGSLDANEYIVIPEQDNGGYTFKIFSKAPADSIREQINNDLDKIMHIAKDAISNSDNSRLKVVKIGLATFYIVSPFTFEATAAVLTSKYIYTGIKFAINNALPLQPAMPNSTISTVYSRN